MHKEGKKVQLKLAKDEVVLKSWDYAKAGNTFDKHKKECNLTVTTKRVISTIENEFELERQEIPLHTISGIDGNYKKNNSFWAKLKLYVGIPLCLVIIGIPMVISALKQLRACLFELTIDTTGTPGKPLSIGMQGAASHVERKHLFANSVNKFKVYVDKALAREVLDEIGALVLDSKK